MTDNCISIAFFLNLIQPIINREADQRLCFRYIDNTIPLLSISISEISSLYLSSVAVQPGLCRNKSETRMLVFSRCGSFLNKKTKDSELHTHLKKLIII